MKKRLFQILLEGGNVFSNTAPFDHKYVPEILDRVNQALAPTGIKAIPIGSTATPTPGNTSGDMDLLVDESLVLQYFNVADAKEGRRELKDFLSNQGFETAQTGISVHIKVPVNSNNAQVDIIVTPNAERVSLFHKHNIPKGSPYKGKNKQLLMGMLAREHGYLWSGFQGLFIRTADGKKGEFVSDELDKIAEILTGTADATVLGSAESILASLPADKAKELLSHARKDPNWIEKQV